MHSKFLYFSIYTIYGMDRQNLVTVAKQQIIMVNSNVSMYSLMVFVLQ